MNIYEIELLEKFGQKSLDKAKIIADSRFGEKKKLKLKFYKSVLDGTISLEDQWVDDKVIDQILTKFKSTPDEKKLEFINNIINNYDTSQPQIKSLIDKYKKLSERI